MRRRRRAGGNPPLAGPGPRRGPVHIVVLLKAVPVVGTERLDANRRTERGPAGGQRQRRVHAREGAQADRGARRRGVAAVHGSGHRHGCAAQGAGDGRDAGLPRAGRGTRRLRHPRHGGRAGRRTWQAHLRPRVRRRRHVRRAGRRGRPGAGGPARAAVPLLRLGDRARSGRQLGAHPPPQPDGLRRPGGGRRRRS